MAVSILFGCLKSGTGPRFFQYRISNTGFPIPYPIPSMMDGWPAGYDGLMAGRP